VTDWYQHIYSSSRQLNFHLTQSICSTSTPLGNPSGVWTDIKIPLARPSSMDGRIIGIWRGKEAETDASMQIAVPCVRLRPASSFRARTLVHQTAGSMAPAICIDVERFSEALLVPVLGALHCR